VVEKLARVRFVVMDVDGTIRSADDQTAEAVAQTLGRLDKAGIGWSFATGRTIAGLHTAAPSILGRPRGRAMLPAICYNGGVLFVPGVPSILSIRHMDRSDVLRALELGTSMGMSALVYSCRNQLGEPLETVCTSATPTEQTFLDINGMPTTHVSAWEQTDLSSTVAVLLMTDACPSDAKVALLQKMIGTSVRVTGSGGPFYEISSAETSKGEALLRLVKETRTLSKRHRSWTRFLGMTQHDVMAIGDNLNDVEMLAAAGVGVAVANASEAVKQSADLVCSLPAGQGTVEALRLLLDVRRYYAGGATVPYAMTADSRP
jgi:hydroxymethylpyrimidine pyrophosphatase-like HAD family hydrolase